MTTQADTAARAKIKADDTGGILVPPHIMESLRPFTDALKRGETHKEAHLYLESPPIERDAIDSAPKIYIIAPDGEVRHIVALPPGKKRIHYKIGDHVFAAYIARRITENTIWTEIDPEFREFYVACQRER